MDANELATIAFDAMPLEVLAPADKGQVWGVLQMALRTLEAQHEALLAEADEETSNAMQVIAEVTAERDALRKELFMKTPQKPNMFERGEMACAPALQPEPTHYAEMSKLRQELATLLTAYNSSELERNGLRIERDAAIKERDDLRARLGIAQEMNSAAGRIHYAATQPGHLEP